MKKRYNFRRSPGHLQVVKIARQHGLIFNNIQDAAILTDSAPNIVDWNPAAVRIFGFSRQEVLGQSPAILYRSQDRPFLPHHIWSVLIQDGRYEGEVTFIDCQGVEKVGEIVIVSLHNLGGEVVGSLGVFHVITGRVLAEQALARERNILRTLIDSLPDAVFAKDIEARKILSNPTDVAYMGLSSEADVLGRTDAEIYPAEVAADFYADDMRVLTSGQPLLAREGRMPDGQGKWRWILSSKVPLRDDGGKVIGLVGITRDMSAYRQSQEAEREQRTLAEALRDTATALTTTLSIEEVLDRVLTNVSRVVPHDSANIMLLEGERAHIVRHKQTNQDLTFGIDENPDLQFSYKELPIIARLVITGQPVVVADTDENPDWIYLPTSWWVRSYIGAPIIIKNETIGFLGLNSATPNFYKPEHAERLQAFADQVAISIQNARLYITDYLTGLYNRRGLIDLGRTEVARALRFNRPLSILFGDIDHFGDFNRRYSYTIGDQVLVMVAQTLMNGVRSVDVVGRFGGEEFVILLLETPLATAAETAERLRKLVEGSRLVTSFGELRVTISLGVVQLGSQDIDLAMLIDQAGAAASEAKQRGRNQIVVVTV